MDRIANKSGIPSVIWRFARGGATIDFRAFPLHADDFLFKAQGEASGALHSPRGERRPRLAGHVRSHSRNARHRPVSADDTSCSNEASVLGKSCSKKTV